MGIASPAVTEQDSIDMTEQLLITLRFVSALLLRAKTLFLTSTQVIESGASLRISSPLRTLAPPLARASQRSSNLSPRVDNPPLSSGPGGLPPNRVHGALPPRVDVTSPLRAYSSIRDVAPKLYRRISKGRICILAVVWREQCFTELYADTTF